MLVYSSENPVFACFSFYAALLCAKTLIMSFLTARQRFNKRVVASPEDVTLRANSKFKVDEDVERVRRAHLNDLENILPFLVLGLLFIGTGPSLNWAKILFRTFTACRFLHTIVYAVVVTPQPARALAFGGGMLVNIYMAFSILMHYADATL